MGAWLRHVVLRSNVRGDGIDTDRWSCGCSFSLGSKDLPLIFE